MTSGTVIEIYTDGACRSNPGPGGWGALLVCGSREKELSGAEDRTTNNRMELMAAVEALAAVKRRPESRRSIRLTTDSRYLKDGVTRWMPTWKSNGWRTRNREPVKNQDLWRRLDELVAHFDVDWHWVKGHSGHPGNERADALANAGIDRILQREGIKSEVKA